MAEQTALYCKLREKHEGECSPINEEIIDNGRVRPYFVCGKLIGFEPPIINEEGRAARELSPFPYNTIFWLAIKRVTEVVFREGAENYGPNNWRKGLPFSDTFNHAMNHLIRWKLKQLNIIPKDEEDDLAKAFWGIGVLMEHEFTHPEFNNLAEMTTEGKRIK